MRYLAQWYGDKKAIVIKRSKLSDTSVYHWFCEIVEVITPGWKVGSEIHLVNSELTPLEDPVDILKEML